MRGAKIFFLVILTSLFAVRAVAQRDNDPMAPGSFYEVSGQVRSADNRTVENVMVRIETSTGVLVEQGTADNIGRFRFVRLRPGQYRVFATAAGLSAPPQAVDLSRVSPRVHLLFQLAPTPPTFRSAVSGRAGVVDARVPLDAQAAVEKARAATAGKKTAEAITHLQKATQIFPDYYEAHRMLGQLYMDASQWEKAEASLRQAVRIDPKAVPALTSLGEVYRREKKYAEAQKILEAALKLDNNSWESNFTLGRIYWELKDLVKSGKYVARSIELQPNVAEGHLLAGNIFIRAGLPENALIEYQEYLRLAPNGEFFTQTQELVDKLKKNIRPKQ
ncbi:MAG TPA: tetratricopeptide repeat protein [Pyrinomonadaceae bacterium]|nr:tetratricopeptide repeat protein [Pyrinomonadaceae bacterium]